MAESTWLPVDATLQALIATLANKADFIPKVYAVMNRYQREHGPVVLRVGVAPNSKGKLPNYRIDDTNTGDVVAVINGTNHQPWPDDEVNRTGNWSKAVMTFAEVKVLMGEVRGQQRQGGTAR